MNYATILPKTLAALTLAMVVQVTPSHAAPRKPLATKAAKAARPGTAKKPAGKLTEFKSRHAARIASSKSYMARIIQKGWDGVNGDTPAFEAFLETPGEMQQTGWGNYDKGIAPEHKLVGLPDNNLKFTVLMPASGHNGWATAQRYAKENVYVMRLVHADGSVENLPNVKSTGLVTELQINAKIKPGTTQLQFWPIGSAALGGYASGRIIKLNWDGKTTGKATATAAAPSGTLAAK